MGCFLFSAAYVGLQGVKIKVEADIHGGLPRTHVVGLPDVAVSEARERVRSAILNSDLPYPLTTVVINLAPSDVKKHGTHFDLPIALAVLRRSRHLADRARLGKYLFAGELGLDGSLRPVRGALILAQTAKACGFKGIVLPRDNGAEAAVVPGIEVRTAAHLNEVLEFVNEKEDIPVCVASLLGPSVPKDEVLLEEIIGQEVGKRALLLSAAGGHHALFFGPPGSGKTLLARALASLLPPLSYDELLEVLSIQSLAGMFTGAIPSPTRPFRSPHHGASSVALGGGGSVPRPGEISLAHQGVLFLDEFLEFSRTALEMLREPLEEGSITVARAAGSLHFPAKFTLLGATNPCPCGYFADSDRTCVCSPRERTRYLARLSGPLLDRIDLHCRIPRLPTSELLAPPNVTLTTATARAQILEARERQRVRYADLGLSINARLPGVKIRQYIRLTQKAEALLASACQRFHFSPRVVHRALKVAQTSADLGGHDIVDVSHLSEALQFRQTLLSTT